MLYTSVGGTKRSKNIIPTCQKQTLFSFGVTLWCREYINAAAMLLLLLSLPNCVCLWWCYRFLGGLSTFVCDLEVLYDINLPAVLFLQELLAAAWKTHRSIFFILHGPGARLHLEEGSCFTVDKRVERVGACDGPSQEAVQTSTWSTWHLDATVLSFWWSCLQQNICNRITGSETDARRRENVILFNPTSVIDSFYLSKP